MDPASVGKVLLLSAAPIAELRGGIPLALALGLPPAPAYLLAVAGNFLPVPLLLIVLPRLLPLLGRLPGRAGRLVGRYLTWQRARSEGRVHRWGAWALFLLVAVPLPATGAWTGSLVAALLGVPARRAFPPIAAGVLAAGILVLLASLGVIALL